jgi:hypothetical protein
LTAYAGLFCRGFGIVALTAMNVVQIARGQYLGAFCCGFGISLVWWYNARHAGRSDLPGAGLVYGFGAACGTVAGMAAGGLF